MTNHEQLGNALKYVAPDVAGDLNRAGRAARDARRARRFDGLEDETLLPEGMAARLRAEGREDANHAVRRAAAKAKRAAKAAARDLEDAPTAESLEEFEAYHAERAAQADVPAPPAAKDDSTDDIPLAEIDIREASLARRALNEALQKAAAEEEAKAKADWVERTGGKSKLGVGFKGHGREEAGRSAPMNPDPEADAAALADFQTMLFITGYEKRADRKDRDALGDKQQNNAPRAARDKSDCRPPPTRRR